VIEAVIFDLDGVLVDSEYVWAEVPLIEGAFEAAQRLGRTFRLELASSSNRPLIDAVLAASGLSGRLG
jgi:beta-phosphoglucomutase-like phosphatase (HAD superfamily)